MLAGCGGGTDGGDDAGVVVADVKLNTDLQVTGDLRRPSIVGSVEVENGTVHLAELLERVTSSPYSTESVQVPGLDELPGDPETTAASPEAAAPMENLGAFDALDLDV